MEGACLSFQQLALSIQEWNILARITQQLSRWNLNLSTKKLETFPEAFFRHGFLYYIIKQHPGILVDYTQDKLMAVSLTLKKTYSVTCSKFFRSTHNFNLTFVLLPKALAYFLHSRFPTLIAPVLEPLIFQCIIEGVLGYVVDPIAYSILERKVQGKRARQQRETIEINEVQALPWSEKVTRSQKRLHRKAEFDVFSSMDGEQKPLNEFKKEIHQALHLGRVLPSKRQPPSKPATENATPNSGSEWNKHHYSRLNLHQLSSAMALQPGFDNQRGSACITLSKKRELRQTFIPSEYKLERDSLVTTYEPHNPPRPQSWTKIIQQMRLIYKKNRKPKASKTPPLLPHSITSHVSGKAPHKQKSKLQSQMMPVEFIRQKAKQRICVFVQEAGESSSKERGKLANLVEEFGNFEKRCVQRRRKIEREC